MHLPSLLLLVVCVVWAVDASMQPLRETHHTIAFTDDPPPTNLDPTRYHPMQLGNGSVYLCVLPPPPHNPQHVEEDDAEGAFAPHQGVPRRTMEHLHHSLLGWCFSLNLDWWAYKLCWNERVEQFHRRPGMGHGAKASLEQVGTAPLYYLLGSASREDPLRLRHGVDASGERYVYTRYAHGTICDVTHMPREVEVRLYCTTDTDEDGRLRMREVEVCRYVASLYVHRACIPSLMPRLVRNIVTCHHRTQLSSVSVLHGGLDGMVVQRA